MATFGTKIYTFLKGRFVGSDDFGNRYYEERRPTSARPRRWVIYLGEDEATKIPPDWHAWIHHVVATVPDSLKSPVRRKWMRQHRPNLSGTDYAYRPPGHVLKGGHRAKATGDYEPWEPK